MQMESLVSSVAERYDAKPAAQESSKKSVKPERVVADAADLEITPIHNELRDIAEEKPVGRKPEVHIPEKEPSKSSIDAAMSLLNSQIEKTHCAYSYDEEAKRISIKVYDDETDELIREVPPEKSLEALKKIWEIAGIIIDEKR